MQTIFKKIVNYETVMYVLFGVLTTLVDWAFYRYLWSRQVDYRISTVMSWLVAVLFAFITNKLFVFRNYNVKWNHLWKEFSAFIACRGASGLFTLVSMMLIVGLLQWHELVGKVISSFASLVLNYFFSKWFIFRKPKSSGRSS